MVSKAIKQVEEVIDRGRKLHNLSNTDKILDEIAKDKIKKSGEAYLKAKLETLNELLEEIKEEGYETFSQLNGAIHSNIKLLEKIKAGEK